MALKPFFRVSRRSFLLKWLTGNSKYNRDIIHENPVGRFSLYLLNEKIKEINYNGKIYL